MSKSNSLNDHYKSIMILALHLSPLCTCLFHRADRSRVGECFDGWFKDSGTVIPRYWGFNVLRYLGLTLDALYMRLSHS